MRPSPKPSPLQPLWLLFAALLAVIFVIHSALMLLEPWLLPRLGEPLGKIAEAAILTAALAPVVWWFVVRPLRSTAASERMRAGDALRSIVQGTAAATGDEFFRELVRHVASALQVRYALVGELQTGPPERIRTIAVWTGEGFGENIEYLLEGTPCENVVGQSLCCYADDVQARFPKDRLLGDMGVDSYLGAPLFDASGAPLGLLVVMDDKPVREEETARSIVSVFAARAGAELERRRAAEAVEAAERQFRMLAEQSLVGIYIIQEGRFRYVNPRVAEMLGYPREELESRVTVDDTVAPQDRALVAGKIRERIEGGATSVRYTFRARRKDGTLTWLEVHGTRTELDGKPAIVGTALDVTERQRAEQALRESERLHRTIVEHSNDMIFTVDAEGRFLFWNQRCEEVSGHRFADWSGRTFAPLIVEEELPRVMEIFGAILRGEPQRYEVPVRRRDGSVFLLAVNAAPTYEGERVVGAVSFGRDITEQRRAEEALRRSEASLREFVENAVFGIYRSTVDGGLTMVNQTLVTMLGFDSAAEMLALDMASGLYRDPDERDRLIAQYGSHERFDGIEVYWKRKDGSPITVRLSGRPLRDERGMLQGFEVIVEDIRERHALEQQLRQAQKMEAVGQLAGGMAHDFNNLLTTILATSELVSAELPTDSPLRVDVEAIREAGLHGTALTSKLLAFSRRKPLELQPLHLGELLGDFTRLVRRLVPESIEVRMVLEPGGATVRADPGAIEQILMNLVTNARDAMQGGGTLLIETERATLDAEFCRQRGWGTPGEFVALAVSDTGVGMDEETQRRIFEPFFTTKPVGAGTGLGMAMVYGLTKQQRGYVHVYSERGRGTTVTVYFPVVEAQAGRRATGETRAIRGGTETILVVEDEASLRRVAERALRKYGYTVLLAADGREALDLVNHQKGAIDLIITDIVMPRMDGPELVNELRREGRQTRVLLTSGYTGLGARTAHGLESGLPFLAKPWTVADLLQSVRDALDRHPARGRPARPGASPPAA